VKNWAVRCAEICIEVAKAEGIPRKRVLDIGCAVGRTAFELAPVFD